MFSRATVLISELCGRVLSSVMLVITSCRKLVKFLAFELKIGGVCFLLREVQGLWSKVCRVRRNIICFYVQRR